MSLEEHLCVEEMGIIISDQQPGEILGLLVTAFAFDFLAVKDQNPDSEDDDEMLRRAIALSMEEQ